MLNLHEALDHLDEEHAETAAAGITTGATGTNPDTLALHALTIMHPDGTVMISGIDAEVQAGEWVLIKGESGSGKSTLLRAVAGLWPWGSGRIDLPARGRIVFIPQRPYLPIGTLRSTLLYPDPNGPGGRVEADDDVLRKALRDVGLDQLCSRLDEADQWDKTLSGGEQQRLAFARALLARPDWLFLDEATAALDDENQVRLMELLRERLPKASVVSIGHRPELERFHGRQLVLVRHAEGMRLERGSYIRQAAIRDFRRERQTRREKALRRFGDALAAARARDTYRWPGR